VKHAHSEQNPEKDWGLQTLQAVEFAFWALNQQFGTALPDGRRTQVITPANTLVIASSVSNGAGAALAAAEQDTGGWIDGVAVTEPNIQIAPGGNIRIERGSLPAYTAGSRPLFDYFSYGNLLQPCAALSAAVAAAPLPFNAGTAFVAGNRCAALAAAGLVTGAPRPKQADDALARLRAYGWEPEADLLHASHYQFATPAIAVTYANTYGRFRVSDHVCGFSFAAVDGAGAPVAANPALINGSFGLGNGVPPTLGLQIVYNDAVGGAKNHFAGGSASTGALDLSYDGALCLRNLWTGSSAEATRVKAGIAETYRSADLKGKPTIIVHGRADTLVPANFSSRPYVARNAQVEGAASRVRYVEVTNAQHFDAFLGFPGYDTRYVPLHLYYIRAMDAMWAHLKNGTALPPSQVVRTTPRGGTPGAAAANVPPMQANPPAADRITVDGNTLRIPEFDVVPSSSAPARPACSAPASPGSAACASLLIDHAPKVAEKIRISGGGRCNFTNRDVGPANFLSDNPHFCRSALARYTPADFIALVQRHGIAFHEKHRGQLFCDDSSEQIIALLRAECAPCVRPSWWWPRAACPCRRSAPPTGACGWPGSSATPSSSHARRWCR
jgi:hydroxybutyrate-dimer hydrolase